MAKGNLFLGMGRGSVGDVTFYRSNGQQLARARNRNPRNPKSNAQLIQRAISATIVQAYKAGSIIFDHSFEGKSVPGGNQRTFLSVNMRKLRAEYLVEQDQQLNNTDAAFVAPRSTFPVPNRYRISEGSLIQNLMTIDRTDELAAKLVSANEGETIAQYLSRLGVSAGEIFTIVVFATLEGDRSDLVPQQSLFGFMRLTVKESAIASTTAMSAATYGDFFDIDSSGAVIESSRSISNGITISELNLGFYPVGAMGIIRSEENSGLRSTSDMELSSGYEWGIAAPNVIPVWSQESAATQSELILEGGPI